MALQMALLHIEILLANKTIRVVTLPDRRPNASSSQSLKWLYQIDLDSVLYGSNNDKAKSTGAVYRLLKRTPEAAGRALCLRKTSTAGGLITEAEWESLREHLHTGVRSFTLVPVDVAVKAATVFGETQASAQLVEALGYDRPAEWDEESEGEEEEVEEEKVEDEEDEGEEDDSDSGPSAAATGARPAWRPPRSLSTMRRATAMRLMSARARATTARGRPTTAWTSSARPRRRA